MWEWHKPSWEDGAARPYIGLGNRLLEGTRTQEKGAVTSQETDLDLSVSVQESPAEAWDGGGLLHSWGHCVQQGLRGPLQEGSSVSIASTIAWPRISSGEGTQLHPSAENRIRDLLSTALPIRARPSFPLSQSLPSGTFHKSLILLHQRADRTTEN